MRLALAFLALMVSARTLQAQRLSTTNKIMLGVSSAAILADCISTRYAVKHGAVERNPLLGSNPSGPRIRNVCAVGLALNAGLLGWFFKGNERNYAWSVVAVFELGNTVHNMTLTFSRTF